MEINVTVTITLAKNLQEWLSGIFSMSMPAITRVEKKEVKQVVEPAKVEKELTGVTEKIHYEEEENATVDIAEVRDTVSALVRNGKKAQVVDLLSHYGVTGYSQLKDKDLYDFYKTIKTL